MLLYTFHPDRKNSSVKQSNKGNIWSACIPSVPAKTRAKRIERVSGTLEAVLMGMVLPVIYVSERQDGSLLVLDASDRLQYLMEFLEGRCPLDEKRLSEYAELHENTGI